VTVLRRGLAALALLLVAAPADAGRAVVYAEGGVAVRRAPVEFVDGWKNGVSIAGGVGYRTGPWMEVGAAVSIERFDADARKVAGTLLPGVDLTNATVLGGDASVIFLSGEARLFFPLSLSRVSLWASGAGGLWRRTFEDVSVEVQDAQGTTAQDVPIPTDQELAVAAGAGLGYRVGGEVWLTFEGRWLVTVGAEEETRILPFRIGFAYR
jgi:hypothetical protein